MSKKIIKLTKLLKLQQTYVNLIYWPQEQDQTNLVLVELLVPTFLHAKNKNRQKWWFFFNLFVSCGLVIVEVDDQLLFY